MEGILQNNLPHYQITDSSKLIGNTAKRSPSNIHQPIAIHRAVISSKKRIKSHEACRSSPKSHESEDIDQNRELYTSTAYGVADVFSVKPNEINAAGYRSHCIVPPVGITGFKKVGSFSQI